MTPEKSRTSMSPTAAAARIRTTKASRGCWGSSISATHVRSAAVPALVIANRLG